MRVMLNVTRQYFKIIAWYFIDKHTSVFDSNLFPIRKVSIFDLIYYITHLGYRTYRQTRINRITKPSSDACLIGRFPMERRDHYLRYLRQRICGTLHHSNDLARISICEDGNASLKGCPYQTWEVILRPSNALS